MTDTTILDGMMRTLQRNPMVEDRMKFPLAPLGSPTSQFVETDVRPFYAKAEPKVEGGMNAKYAERVDLFHQDVKGVRLERPRRGSCGRVRTVERHIDGEVWTRNEVCPGVVHAVETKINGAMRVDGKCLTCGWEVHRAGLLNEKGN